MLIKSQSEVRLHTGRSVHFHPSRCARPSFSIFRGSGSETTSGSSWQIMFHIYVLETTIKLSMVFKFWGCVTGTHTLERILFLDLGVAVTEINTKKV